MTNKESVTPILTEGFHLDEGSIILDIKGEEKQKLTVEDLLKRFGKASGEVFANDRALLS